jgi:hypothetical protein
MPSQPSIHLLVHLQRVDPHPMEIFLQAMMAEEGTILMLRNLPETDR